MHSNIEMTPAQQKLVLAGQCCIIAHSTCPQYTSMAVLECDETIIMYNYDTLLQLQQCQVASGEEGQLQRHLDCLFRRRVKTVTPRLYCSL